MPRFTLLATRTSTQWPSTILFAPYNAADRAGWLQSGSLASVTLTELQALSGTIILTVAGTLFTSSSITLSAATSLSDGSHHHSCGIYLLQHSV